MDGWENDERLFAAAALAVVATVILLRIAWMFRKVWRSVRRALRPSRKGRPTPWPRAVRRSSPSQPRQVTQFTLRRFWVIDGDTIRNNTTGTTYRLENIDCPETEDRARCFRERNMGERAKFEAIRLLKGASTITVHPTGKIDPYGRSVASIRVDGQDFGQLMIARGFARPWRGVREDWCGPNGGLVRMAEACSARFHCKTCGGRAGLPSEGSNVVSLPMGDSEPPIDSSQA